MTKCKFQHLSQCFVTCFCAFFHLYPARLSSVCYYFSDVWYHSWLLFPGTTVCQQWEDLHQLQLHCNSWFVQQHFDESVERDDIGCYPIPSTWELFLNQFWYSQGFCVALLFVLKYVHISILAGYLAQINVQNSSVKFSVNVPTCTDIKPGRRTSSTWCRSAQVFCEMCSHCVPLCQLNICAFCVRCRDGQISGGFSSTATLLQVDFWWSWDENTCGKWWIEKLSLLLCTFRHCPISPTVTDKTCRCTKKGPVSQDQATTILFFRRRCVVLKFQHQITTK